MLVHWNELTREDFKTLLQKESVVVGCFDSTEQHSLHLPVGTDAFLGQAVVCEAARRSKAAVIALPPVYYGYSPHHRFTNGFLTVSQRTLMDYAKDIALSVRANGFKRLAFINAHGGNTVYLNAVVNEVGELYCDDFKFVSFHIHSMTDEIVRIRTSNLGGIGHAGELKTSLMMYLHPELVRVEKIKEYAPTPQDKWYCYDTFGKRRYHMYRNMNNINPEGNNGQPQYATRELGERFFNAMSDGMAAFFNEFSRGDWREDLKHHQSETERGAS